MRLAGIASMEAANAFLPDFIARHNAQFAIEAVDPNPAFVAMEADCDYDYYFSMQETRTVKADHTLSFEGQTFQIKAASRTRSLAGSKVSVRVNPEGQIHLYDGKRRLDYSLVAPNPPRLTTPPLSKANPENKPPDPATAARKRGWLNAQAM